MMTEKERLRPAAQAIWRCFQQSGRKHLFLTGERGSGKSTLLNELIKNMEPLPGIRTKAVPRREVILTDLSTGESAVIGRFAGMIRPDGMNMEAVTEGLEGLGVAALKRAIAHESDRVMIDEIGYLESECEPFLQALNEVLVSKSVLAVIRKNGPEFLEKLREREDAFVYDLDEEPARVGAIIMASGVSRRFGSNKLLADFDGRKLIEHILDKTDTPLLAARVVVTRHPEIEAICRERNIPCILHDLPFKNDTLRLGTEYLTGVKTFTTASATEKTLRSTLDGIMICPGDQPLLRAESIEAMVLAFSRERDKVFRMHHGEDFGLPTVFPKEFFAGLMSLPEDKGGIYLIRKEPDRVRTAPAADPFEMADCDTPEELERLLEEQKRRLV